MGRGRYELSPVRFGDCLNSVALTESSLAHFMTCTQSHSLILGYSSSNKILLNSGPRIVRRASINRGIILLEERT
jgi:hypothetical protein